MERLLTINKKDFLAFTHCELTSSFSKKYYNKENKKYDLSLFLKKVKKHPKFKDSITVKKDKRYIRKLETLKELNHSRFIFNATFIKTKKPIRMRTYIDILESNEDGTYNIYLIKPSNHPKEEYLKELNYNKICLDFCGLKIKKLFLVHLNSQYIKNERVSYKVIKITDLTDKTNEKHEESQTKILKLINIKLNKITEPQKINFNKKYNKCESCPFKNKCWENIPNNSILYLNRLTESNILNYKKQNINIIPQLTEKEYLKLTYTQRRQVHSYIKKTPYVNKKEIENKIGGVNNHIFISLKYNFSVLPLDKGDKPNQLNYTHIEVLKDKIQYTFNLKNKHDIIRLFNILNDADYIITFNKNYLQLFLQKHKEYFHLNIANKIINLDSIFKNYSFYTYQFKNDISFSNICTNLGLDSTDRTESLNNLFTYLNNLVSKDHKISA